MHKVIHLIPPPCNIVSIHSFEKENISKYKAYCLLCHMCTRLNVQSVANTKNTSETSYRFIYIEKKHTDVVTPPNGSEVKNPKG